MLVPSSGGGGYELNDFSSNATSPVFVAVVAPKVVWGSDA